MVFFMMRGKTTIAQNQLESILQPLNLLRMHSLSSKTAGSTGRPLVDQPRGLMGGVSWWGKGFVVV